jgi:hypothetical protein
MPEGRNPGTNDAHQSMSERALSACSNALRTRADFSMQVHFHDDQPIYDGTDIVVRFVAEVDGSPVVCAMTAEALEDHFGAESILEGDLIEAFTRGRTRIQAICRQALEESGGAAVILHSGLFRVHALMRK